jgi:carboxyl-terminal processing protease
VPGEGPAHRADLRPDDRIVSVDGVALAGRDSEAVQRLLSGEVGSRARLEVLRDGRLVTLAVEREPYAKKGVAR